MYFKKGGRQMTLSVIVTTYNRPDYLRRVLNSYLSQRRLPDEIVVADDGSGPETRQAIDEFARSAPFPVVHAWQEDRGVRVAKARNLATRMAQGDYLVYSDGDCITTPHFVLDHARLARKGRFVQGRRVLLPTDVAADFTGREKLTTLLRFWLKGHVKRHDLYKLLHIPHLAYTRKGHKLSLGCNVAVWREDIYKVNGWDERYEGWGREDDDLTLRLQKAGSRRTVALCSCVVFHLPHSESSRSHLPRNDRLRKEAESGPAFVPTGLRPEEPNAAPS